MDRIGYFTTIRKFILLTVILFPRERNFSPNVGMDLSMESWNFFSRVINHSFAYLSLYKLTFFLFFIRIFIPPRYIIPRDVIFLTFSGKRQL